MVTAMRAARLHEIGGTLQVDEIDDPVPADGEVVVDIALRVGQPTRHLDHPRRTGRRRRQPAMDPRHRGQRSSRRPCRAGARRRARGDAPRSLPRAGGGPALGGPRAPRRARPRASRRVARRRRHRLARAAHVCPGHSRRPRARARCERRRRVGRRPTGGRGRRDRVGSDRQRRQRGRDRRGRRRRGAGDRRRRAHRGRVGVRSDRRPRPARRRLPRPGDRGDGRSRPARRVRRLGRSLGDDQLAPDVPQGDQHPRLLRADRDARRRGAGLGRAVRGDAGRQAAGATRQRAPARHRPPRRTR